MILMRDTSAACSARFGRTMSRNVPSILKRTSEYVSNASMWMSDAPSRAACVSSALIMRMIGASSSVSKQILDVGDLLHHSRDIEFAFDVADDLLRRPALITIGLRNRRDQLARLDNDRLDLAGKDADDLVQRCQRCGVTDPDLGIALALRYEQDGVVACERVGDEAVGGDH